jgi:glycosyltransferase involved in cell wall biosynthesis
MMSTILRGASAPLIGDTSLRIAQVAPLCESVPPTGYGGTERSVSFLTEELVVQGHAVTLFASGDSVTAAEFVPCSPVALRLDPTVHDAVPWHLLLLERVRQRAREFDVLHFHIDLFQFPLLRELGVPALTTLHGRLDLADLKPFYREFADARLVSISDDQRRPMPPVNWLGTVHHGLPADLLRFQPSPAGDYLAFLGRISPEKRPDRAIEIARRAGMRLKMAAKLDQADRQYWTEVIEPMVRGNPLVEFVGEIGDYEKQVFLGDAAALVFPIDWPEPFGIVMIEAMACGTPVLAFACGSVPEVVDNGISGYLVETVDEAVEMLPKTLALDRAGVRAAFDRRFTARRMARDYLSLYRRLVASARGMAREAITAVELEGEYATKPGKIGGILADRPHGPSSWIQNL